jgi:signal transduction histidine kinase
VASSIHSQISISVEDASGEVLRSSTNAHATGMTESAAPVGLGQLQRNRVLAGSDPLVPDLMLALDLLEDGMLLLHEDGRVIHSNHAAAALAWPVKSSSLRSLHLLGPSEPWVACRQMLREYQQWTGVLERQVRDAGTGRSWSLRLSALAYLGVVPRRLVLVIRDISEAVKTRDRLQEREVLAATGTLLAGAAHQAKNTIFGLSASLEAMEERIRKDRAVDDECVSNLRLGISGMQTLIRDLLDYANPTQSEPDAVSMAAVVRHGVSACRSLARATGVEIVLELDLDAEVMANATRLVRAMENLLENALQHSPRGGTVKVRLSRPTGGERGLVRCEVLDQGPGFPPEHLESVLTPFFTRRPGGTGLGLTIAKRIVEACGGVIRLTNRAGGGAQVAVILPARYPPGEASQLRNPFTESAGAAK